MICPLVLSITQTSARVTNKNQQLTDLQGHPKSPVHAKQEHSSFLGINARDEKGHAEEDFLTVSVQPNRTF